MALFFGNMEPALHQAAKTGQQQAVFTMLQSGANINARDSYNRTALHWAAEFGHEGIARVLRVDIEAKGKVGWTALHCAAHDGREAVVRLLLESGANIEAKEFEGQTALQWAAWNGHLGIVRLLLEKGADVTARGKSGWTAMNYASGRGHLIVAQLLSAATISRGQIPQGPPLNMPQYNPFLQAPRVNYFGSQPQSAMHFPSFGHHPRPQHHTTALGFGPTASLQSQLTMQQYIAFPADQQVAVVTDLVTPSANPWADFASS